VQQYSGVGLSGRRFVRITICTPRSVPGALLLESSVNPGRAEMTTTAMLLTKVFGAILTDS
jgi:hypothetical protein